MKIIEIADVDFTRLQRLAVPLVDTPATLIARLLDQVEAVQPVADAGGAVATSGAVEYSAAQVPSLVHAKLLEARFAGRRPAKTTWDALMRLALEQVFTRWPAVADLRRQSGANVVEGRKDDEGYKFIPERNFSYQGVSAGDAVKIVVRCARALGCAAEFEFEWRDKAGAAKPGQRGIVRL